MSAPAGEQSTAPEGSGPQGDEQDDASAQEALAQAAQEADGDDDGDDGELDPKVKAKIERANREAQALRARIKDLEPLAKQAKDRADADKTEAQKLTEQKAELEIQISALTVANVRRDAAEAAGLAPKFVKFITAAEPDEALAQAKELAKELKPPTDTAANGRPADLRQGSRGSTKPSSESRDDLVRRMAGF